MAHLGGPEGGFALFLDLLCLPSQIMAQGKSAAPPSGPIKQVNKLDNMLGSLQSDLNRLGVQTVAKGVCGACKKPIAGQVGRRPVTFIDLCVVLMPCVHYAVGSRVALGGGGVSIMLT